MALLLPEKKSSLGPDLAKKLGQDKVRWDWATLKAYSVDASIYKIPPQVVVLPETEEDIHAVMEYAVKVGVPLTPRAAGTNLTGSAIGAGIIVDISRMNRLLEVNRDEQWARVQPGLVLSEFNKQLAPMGLMYGPDPSSGDMCKLGGMFGNNSAGPHTLRYGSVKDNVHTLRIRLLTEGWLDAQSVHIGGPAHTSLLKGFPSLKAVWTMIQEEQALIRARRPKVSKNSSGYNVFDLVDGLERGVFEVQKLFIGSEGTLGIMSEATVKLVKRPDATVTGLIHFRHLEGMGESVPHLLELNPNALEVMDGNSLDLIGRNRYGIPSDAAATLLIEFDEGGGADRRHRLMEMCKSFPLTGEVRLASDPAQQGELWKARKALFPMLYRFDPRKKPINFVDDVVVPASRTGELIRYLEEYFGGRSVPVAIFGHVGNGNAHIVPLLDLHNQHDVDAMVEAHREIHQTVLDRFDGSICGEHGDGRIRAETVRLMYGEEVYQIFVRVKQAFDPQGMMNPGVKISDTSFTEHIDVERMGKPCATCAKCNSVCPVYDVFQSEDMSARGWFEIVTASDYSYLQSERVVEACLNCKSCRTICPAGVDVSELILQRRAEQPNELAGWVFALHARQWIFHPLLKLVAWTQSFWDRPVLRGMLEKLTRPVLRKLAPTAKIPRDMVLPTFAKRHLRDRYPELCHSEHLRQASIAYFHGCAANYFEDGVGDAVIGLLADYGVKVALPPQRCSGTPIETYGLRDLVKEGARENLAHLASYATVITSCASCTLSLKDYVTLFHGEPEEAAAIDLSKRVKHISEYLVEQGMSSANTHSTRISAEGKLEKVTYHSSCHLRAAGVSQAPRDLLASVADLEFVEMQDADRCAGGAGTYIVKNYETSQKIFQRKKRAIQESGAQVVATSCPACMIQLKNGLRGIAEVKHIAQVMREHPGRK
ncbi:FAD-binding and (Fe-S)-binding domain-containing protein [Candidatus Nitrospira allomarina]|uniref:D-lactate dehydrogenase (cytochrome) n=1 Tax=Candidatus Nitrospira allomarina TaxID=3020900 RepID=A0AA96G847_9BACT|nr:FAD-linked oxidase C-terminal domain-containing protein [Candidatus Nitrospira allomarina]WNM56492.1 FAD-linked oxidase C-terminal domain-containing protein [Candidatus Nitrospira allomarina]